MNCFDILSFYQYMVDPLTLPTTNNNNVTPSKGLHIVLIGLDSISTHSINLIVHNRVYRLKEHSLHIHSINLTVHNRAYMLKEQSLI